MTSFASGPTGAPAQRAEARRILLAVLVLTLVALAMRVYRLDFFALRGDESFTVQFSLLPADELFEGIRSVEPNPPLYYYALQGWMAVAGQGEYATRFFSVFFGVLCVPLIYVLGRTLGGPLVGLIAAGIVAVNPFQLFHSQDVRNYTLWPAVLLAQWCFLWRAVRRGRKRDWATYVLLALLGLYTHYYHAFVMLADSLFVLSLIGFRWRGDDFVRQMAYRDRRRLLAHWCVSVTVIGIGFAVWLAVGSTRAIEEISSGASPTLFDVIGQTFAALTIGETLPKDLIPALVIPPAILFVAGLVAMGRARPQAARLMLLGLVVPMLCVFVVAQMRPLYRPRYLNVTAAAYYGLMAYGVVAFAARPRLRWAGAALAAAVLVGSGYGHAQALFNPKFAKSPDWRGRAAYLVEQQQPGDVIVQNYPDPSLGFYYRGDAPLLVVPTGYLDETRRAETERTLADLLKHYSRIWLLPYTNPLWDYDGTVERWLARSADRVWAGQIAGLAAQLYETPSQFGPRIQRLDARFRQGITLIGYRLERDSFHPGDVVRLVLYWQSDARITIDFSVFTHVLDASGAIRAQQDNAPVAGTYPTSQWLVGSLVVDAYEIALPADMPGGPYTIEVGLYDWRTLERLPTTVGADRVVLPATIRVSP